MNNKISVLNVGINAITMQEALNKLEQFIEQKKPHMIVTANAEIVMMAQSDDTFAKILANADLVVPDGAGVVWAARYHGHNMSERVAGYDLSQNLLQVAAIKGYRVFMFGGAPGIAIEAAEKAKLKYPGVNIVGIQDGYFNEQTEQEIVRNIIDTRPDILLVALGVPKQEKWLAAHLAELNVPVAIGVGGTFDVMAGKVQRAPFWMQKAGLEWFYRLSKQPQRAIRMLALPKFVIKVITAKKG